MRTLAIAAVLMAAGHSVAGATTVRQDGARWVLENARLRAVVNTSPTAIQVLDKRARFTWNQAGPQSMALREGASIADGVTFRTTLRSWKGLSLESTVAITMPDAGADLVIRMSADPAARIDNVPFLDSFVLDKPHGVLAIADYSNGHLYPLNTRPFPATWHDADRLDMPWVGLTDMDSGVGYALLVESSDDAIVTCPGSALEDKTPVTPRIIWRASKGVFGYARQIRYRFCAGGGWVALAKGYREYARAKGLLVTLAEKRKRNPNLAKLFGAPDVWGDSSLRFAREARSAGIDKMLIHGRAAPAEAKEVRALGYLTSDYDNYTDIEPILPGKGIDSNHDLLPNAAALQDNGERMKAWLTFDKKTQYMKRCPSLWLPAATQVIPKVIAEVGFLGRFIDVTTAEALYECFDPAHPLTRGDKRQCGEELLKYVRSLRLVVGGEHGIWWGVPHLDYIEGMMSTGYYSWPAGHLIHPKTKDQEFTGPNGEKMAPWSAYAKWGIGHEWRAPLWELVFHDCVVSTWYWGDASDFLLDAAPEVTPKKDAFNVLYGTIPLLWADREGGWNKNRAVFLRTYRNTCKWHEVVAGREMLSHEYLTADHAVQRTRFAGGYTAVVNFGAGLFKTHVRGKPVRLPTNGFALSGPGFIETRADVEGRISTTIRSGSYSWTETEAN